MLAPKNRLRKKQDFENVFKKGISFFFENISIRVAENNQKHSRIGFVVSSKFSKKAVERNKIKRQLRAILFQNVPALKSGKDVVIIPFKKEKMLFQELQKNVEKALKKAKLIN